LHGLGGEGDLVNVELLVHQGAELRVIHLAAAQHLHGFLFQGVQTGSFRGGHLFFNSRQLRVAIVDFGLDNLASCV